MFILKTTRTAQDINLLLAEMTELNIRVLFIIFSAK